MPIFEYRCNGCGQYFECLVFSAASIVECERCGSRQVEKQFSTFSAIAASGPQSHCGSGGCPGGDAADECGAGGCPYRG